MSGDKENIAESCCFVCKDGGDLLICDHKDCLKCYHPFCVKKDDSFLESDDNYVCDRHTCFRCRRSSTYLYCYTCRKSVCRQCHSLLDVDFFQIKGKYGFCDFCLDVVLLIEEKKDYDSDVGKVDFTDKETVEYYFLLYYNTIKDKEGFDLRDLYAAKERGKRRKEHQSTSGIEEEEEDEKEEEGEEYPISNYEGTNDKGKRKRFHEKVIWKRKKSVIRFNKKEYEDVDEKGEEEDTVSDYIGTNGERKCKRLHKKIQWRRKVCAIKSKKMTVTEEKTDHGNTSIVPPQNGHAPDSELEHQNICSTENLPPTGRQQKEKKLEGEELEETRTQETNTGQRASTIEVIELVDSDDDENGNLEKFDDDENGKREKFDDIESDRWCVRGPSGDCTDKCSLSILKDWSEKTSYASKFKVWRDDDDEDNAVGLLEALSIAFSNKSK